jgi:hypothetical protein
MKVSELKPLEKNPFKSVGDEQIKKIAKSIQEFERMMEIRRIVIDEDNNILGGNKRYFALKKLGYKEIPDAWIEKVEGLSEEQKKEFIVKDNAHFGSEWDYELLGEWNVDLDAWGVPIESKSETERLSELKFASIYYEPTEKPNIKLIDCIDTEKFDAKIKVIEESDLSDEKKEVLKMFAYRFLKIDFENVANYYYFNADEKEKRVIERLRLVLCDEGLQGFLEDDILRAHNNLKDWKLDDDDIFINDESDNWMIDND